MDAESFVLFTVAIAIALSNVPLLFIRPGRSEQRLWRRLRVQALRRWVTRRRNPKTAHREGDTVRIARRNIVWHAVLSVVFAALIFHPQLRAWPLRALRYVLLTPCIAYLLGSIVQRQKIVIASNERPVRP